MIGREVSYANEARPALASGETLSPVPLPPPGPLLMAPAFYHYLPLPMDEVWKDKNFRVPRLLCLIGVLGLLVVMAVTLGYFAVKANSEPCQDGLRAEQRCHNVSHHLQAQLTRAQKTLRDADAACNSTVENLNAALTEMKTQEQKQQKQVQDLKDEIKDLKQKLQKAEEEAQQLSDEMASRRTGGRNAAGRGNIPVVPVLAALLLLGLAVVRP
ncbi:bone marrow stromal antigen 2 [Heterocephalus glaber]|uniref:Bone marrow stromal antigen 2 n=2 Tax=Heterocephalus glaber TaxID=10181 RepID=A0AAX6QH11_HETGA|nr:bone marrow stromal antigen 2 [Heterocephalus glaber]